MTLQKSSYEIQTISYKIFVKRHGSVSRQLHA